MIDLTCYPRRRYTHGWTALTRLERFSKAVGGPTIYIKRDDCLGLAGGGNKTRKLEFQVADALAQGADTLVTCGSIQSNHCRLTLSAATIEGLHCRLALEERVAGSYDPEAGGNNFLFRLLEAEKIEVFPGGSDMNAAMAGMAEQAEREGRRPYVIPIGCATPLGALGYVACMQEIAAQAFEQGVHFDAIVHASGGSAGTQAGLLIGQLAGNQAIPVTGISVSADRAAQEKRVYDLAVRTIEFLELPVGLERGDVVCRDEYVGAGYSLATAEMAEAVGLLARTEGILLDPVYTGKGMAGLIGLCRQGVFSPGQNVLFVHTGGTPAIYHYTASVLG